MTANLKLNIILQFDEKSFCQTVFEYIPYWAYEPKNEHIIKEMLVVFPIEKHHIKCDCKNE